MPTKNDKLYAKSEILDALAAVILRAEETGRLVSVRGGTIAVDDHQDGDPEPISAEPMYRACGIYVARP